MSKFKVGDLVYCLPLTHKISKITRVNEDNDVFLNQAGWFKNTGLNHNDMPIIFHATQENYELISKLYPNVAFEPPSFEPSPKSPKRKEPIKKMQTDCNNGWISVDDKSLKQYVDKEILVYASFEVKTAFYRFDDNPCFDNDGVEYDFSHWFSDEFGNFAYNFDEVSHWQPLPKDPKEY